MPDTTSATLLERVRNPSDQSAWREFFGLYFPLIVRYARTRGLDRSEAEEIAQRCMESLARRMPSFQYARRQGRFKNYLRTAAENQIRNARRTRRTRPVSDSVLDRRAADAASSAEWERLWLRQHVLHLLEDLDSRCADGTVRAFRLYVVEGWPVERVCATLGLTANQVYLAKTRMIRRLRREMAQRLGQEL